MARLPTARSDRVNQVPVKMASARENQICDDDIDDELLSIPDLFSESGSEYAPSLLFTDTSEEEIQQRRKKQKVKKPLCEEREFQEEINNDIVEDFSEILVIQLGPNIIGDAEITVQQENNSVSTNESNADLEEISSLEYGPLEKPKKNRYAQPHKWLKHVRKRQRNSGESYINVRGAIKDKKICEEFDCLCRYKCSERISQEQRENNFLAFYSSGSWDTQTAIIAKSIKIVPIKRKRQTNKDSKKSQSREYYLRAGSLDVQVCKLMFMKTLQIDSARIHRALKKALSNSLTDSRGRHKPGNATEESKLQKVHDHIKSFPAYKSHYRRNDTPDARYLCHDLNLSKMYSLYKESVKQEWLENNDGSSEWEKECVSISTYKRIFYKDFNLKFKAPKKDTCKTCDFFKIQIHSQESKPANQQDQQLLEKLIFEREFHHRQAESASTIRKNDIEEATKNEDIHVITFDLQKKFPLPKVTCGEAYYLRQLSLFNLGIHNLGTKQAFMYLWHEGIASRGAQEISSCLINYIKKNVQCSKLIAWSDSCGGQNRNIKVVLVWMYIVTQEDIPVNEIVHRFCVSGHSYLPNDRDFSQIENKLRRVNNMFTFTEFSSIVKSCRQNGNNFKVTEMRSEDFVSTKSLEALITNRKKDETKNKVEWLRIKEIKVEKSSPGILFYKYSHNEDLPYLQVDFRKKKSGPPPVFSGMPLQLLYPNGHAIPELKLKDIRKLLKYVPEVHHPFYENLHAIAINEEFDHEIDFEVEEEDRNQINQE